MKSTNPMIAITQTTTIQGEVLVTILCSPVQMHIALTFWQLAWPYRVGFFFLTHHSLSPSIVLNHSLLSHYS